MVKSLFTLFLVMHVLGDYYFQSDALAQKKRTSYTHVLLHSLLYSLAVFLCALPFWSENWLLPAILLPVLHFTVDSGKFFFAPRHGKEGYLADQLIHLASLFILAAVLVYDGFALKLLPETLTFLSTITEKPETLPLWAGLLLTAAKPANVTIKRLSAKYKPVQQDDETVVKAGATIGTLERILILLFLSTAQYAAIGLVLTAKSVARYNKISEDKQFAEYYLLGTLLSALFAISAYMLFL